jgi:hypothetical protein
VTVFPSHGATGWHCVFCRQQAACMHVFLAEFPFAHLEPSFTLRHSRLLSKYHLLFASFISEDSMAEDESFQYQERIGTGSFRLILIQPHPDVAAPLEGKLITTTLDEYDNSILDHYIALSYVWGDANDRRTVFMNGKTLDITATLDSALRHIREPKRELKIWADGICINQSNIEERNIQVQQMGAMYQLARHTIIYLGESTPFSIRLFDRLASYPNSPDNNGSAYISNISRLSNAKAEEIRNNTSRFPEDSRANVEFIAQRWPWFARIWVLQELVQSPDPWVQIGRQRVRWNTFTCIAKTPDLFGFDSQGLKHLEDMDRLRNSLSPPLWQGDLQDDATIATRLLEILHNRRGLGVSDPRDMIYGHLGVLGNVRPEDEVDKFFQVDYNQPIPELFTQVAIFIVSARGDFDILSQVEERSVEKRTTLPTWVPDWTSPYGSSLFTLRERSPQEREEEDLAVSIGIPPVLGTIGHFEGTIEVVLDSHPPTVDLEAIIDTVLQSKDLGHATGADITQVHVLLHAQLCTWFHEQGVAPSALSRIIPHRYYEDPLTNLSATRSSGQLWLNLWNWIDFNVKRHSSNSRLSMPKIAVGNINHDLELVTALMLNMTDKSQLPIFPGKKIAVLKDKSLLLVPSCAQAGDAVWSFCPGPGHWVLRRRQPEKNAQLRADLLTHFQRVQKSLDAHAARFSLDEVDCTAKWKGHAKEPNYTVRQAVNDALLSTAPVEHANFIGECFPGPFAWIPVLSSLKKNYGRLRPRVKPMFDTHIVALH